MSDMSTDHGTVTAERIVEAPIARVYAAFADPQERERWGAPSDTAVFAYDEADFRVGGRDLARCGPKEDPRFRVEARYLDIVPERRVVSAEIVREIERPLAANLTTLELRPDGERTHVKITVQVTSFVGPDMIKHTKAGHEGSLASMARYVEGRRHPVG
jgi:uncharacterized protein YndB with AHSA1/START domain